MGQILQEWDRMLPYGTLRPDGTYHFKMSEMASNQERMARVPAFFKIIEEHVLLSLSCTINLEQVRRAKERIWVPGAQINWDFVDNRYKFAFRCLLDNFHTHKSVVELIIPLHEKVDFIFDDRTEKKAIIETWDLYMQARPPETRDLYGAAPRFEKDEEFLPLQAADFWAWWVREWYETTDDPGAHIRECNFGMWRGTRASYPKFDISFDEGHHVQNFKTLIQALIEPGRKIYDVRSPNWFEPPWPLGTILGDVSATLRRGLS